MPSYLDLALIAIVVVSALLSMVRGFTREILAIGSWVAAFAAAYFFYPVLLPYLKPYIHKDSLALAAAVALIFFATLIIVSVVTVRISDVILDSKVGPLDRTLGFVFGAARGFALAVIAFVLFNYLVPAAKQPAWVASAKSRPLLQSTGEQVVAMLPDNIASTILNILQKPRSPSDEVPADETTGKDVSPNPSLDDATPPLKKTDAVPTPPAKTPAVTQTDKQKLENLLGKGTTPPAKRN